MPGRIPRLMAGVLTTVVVVASACSYPDYAFDSTTSIDGGDDGSAAGGDAGTSFGASGGSVTGGNGGVASGGGGNGGVGNGGAGAAGGTGAAGAAGSVDSGTAGRGGDAGTVSDECSVDADCAGAAGGAWCDPRTKTCVECLPGQATCAPGLYCTAGQTCALGCGGDYDCVPQGGGGDAGSTTLMDAGPREGGALEGGSAEAGAAPFVSDAGVICLVAEHLCAGCVRDAECPLGTRCELGVCQPACDGAHPCPSDYACCTGECADLSTSEAHCGGCDAACAPPGGVGDCVGGSCALVGCQPGFGDCDGVGGNGCEVDLTSSAAHCSACGAACVAEPHTEPACADGQCVQGPCLEGFGECDVATAGCETGLYTDTSNCGSCGFVCDLLNANERCRQGACEVSSCSAGYANCDGNNANGCEVNLQSDANNCGTCGTVCKFDNAGARCEAGVCKLDACVSPTADCNGSSTDGCEVNKNTDVSNCGACGAACNLPHATALCNVGSCAVQSCDPGWGDCDGNATNGCETNLETSAGNCGACGQPCSTNNGTATCALAACSIACTSGYANCDGNLGNGCEINTNVNVGNCGGCTDASNDYACSAAGGTPNCQGGVCGISSCSGTLADCDGVASNGCEVNTAGNVGNCGGCGLACFVNNGTPGCSGSTCYVSACSASWDDCNGTYADGCETRLTTASNCGACGQPCSLPNATATCATGTCKIGACTAPYADCDGIASNGCETNLDTNVTKCGACDNVCNATNGQATCSGGVCGVVCAPGWGNCNLSSVDGCETKTTDNTAHCGGCGQLCSVQNGTASCTGTTCGVSGCTAPYANCDGQYGNGCETNTNTDPVSCGGCSQTCNTSGGTPGCAGGVCSITCSAGYGDCNGSAADGCETNTNTTLSSCGQCGNQCSFTNAAASCAGGACVMGVCAAGWANCDGATSNGCEVNLNTSAAHCSACGKACNLPNATSTCSGGTCQISQCIPPYEDCDGVASNGCETDLSASPTSCGSCGATCTSINGTATCTAGSCGIVCAAGFANCDGALANGCEISTETDVNHCGTCVTVCSPPAGATSNCVAGVCGYATCTAGFGDCDQDGSNGCEADLLTDAENCSACGAACSVASGAGQCINGSCSVASCDSEHADCNGLYADGCETSLTTLGNCTACGVACSLPNASASCATGTCAVQTCVSPYGDCDGVQGNGCETNLGGSITHCGACGKACSNVNGAASCTGGSCSITCAVGYADCDLNVGNGCETSLTNNVNACGACGTVCAVVNGTATCVGTTCAIATCTAPREDCNGQYADGCETNLSSSVSNCGACGKVCSGNNGTASCVSGACNIACTAGYGDCDLNVANGCESNLGSSVSNCGGCGTACSFANATAVCTGGTCALGACNPGYADCDANPVNGCEVNLQTSAAHCGTCDVACSNTNGTTVCQAGACVPSCSTGYADCDATPENGCETNTRTVNNCDGCGVACSFTNGTASCSTGTCTMTGCQTGWGNCDASTGNGCETYTNSDTGNCGACGAACDATNGTPSCSGGSCAIACGVGWGNCDGSVANGCETNTSATVAHCGACNNACSFAHASATCFGGACQLGACDAGWADCDGSPANGCETDIQTVANCGGCGQACGLPNAATMACTAGSCVVSTCSAGWGNCDALQANGCETNLLTDENNCNACGAVCTTSQPDTVPICQTGVCGVALSCPAGTADCDGASANGCESTLNTLTDCGGCGTTCSVAHGTATCATKTCEVASCTGTWANCNGSSADGCEINLDTSVGNCGGCGILCGGPNSVGTCALGTCTLGCSGGWGNCDGDTTNGCETTLGTTANCGACGAVCTNANGGVACADGTCTPTCSSGYGSCDADPNNGCEASVRTLSNCGSCGVACDLANASESCSSGTCTLGTCTSGWGNCDSVTGNGCETALDTVAHCGSCATICTNVNGSTACTAGSCVPSCNSGYASCDGNDNNGCETNTQSNLSHCGLCNNACSFANAGGLCQLGSCVLGSCAAGYGNCDNLDGTGCEALLATDTNNCGSCGNACTNDNGTTSCSSNQCSPSCLPGWGDCDTNANNGCETFTTTDVNNCGGCSVVCSVSNGTPSCGSSSCGVATCSSGWGNCNSTNPDGGYADGCESMLNTAQNCGACNNTCTNAHGTTSCTTSQCVPTCDTGWSNCDGDPTNGCEAPDVALPPTVNVDPTPWAANFLTAPAWSCTASGTTTINSQTGSISSTSCTLGTPDFTNGVAQIDSGGPNVMVVRLTGMTVSGGHVLKLLGDKPIVLLVSGDVLVDTGGLIDAGAVATTPGAGGNVSCGTTGTGGNGTVDGDGGGGGGGGFYTAGARGGYGNNRSATAGALGAAATDTDLQPLRGGCGGGRGYDSAQSKGGAGGGAFQISASGTITIGTGANAAYLSAAGGGGKGQPNNSGCTGDGGDGGGSGGGILLVSPTAPTFGSGGGSRVHGGGGGGGTECGSSGNGQDGHSTNNTAASGGNGNQSSNDGGAGGVCYAPDCPSPVLPAHGGDSNYGAGGGGGGGGIVRVVVQSASVLSCQ